MLDDWRVFGVKSVGDSPPMPELEARTPAKQLCRMIWYAFYDKKCSWANRSVQDKYLDGIGTVVRLLLPVTLPVWILSSFRARARSRLPIVILCSCMSSCVHSTIVICRGDTHRQLDTLYR